MKTIDFKQFTARQILTALVEGLRNPEYKVNMETFGDLINSKGLRIYSTEKSTTSICIACAATNALTKLTNIKFTAENISSDGLRYKGLKDNNIINDRLEYTHLESALDYLRTGNINGYNYHGFVMINNPRHIILPFLGNDYTEEQLQVYESLIADQIED